MDEAFSPVAVIDKARLKALSQRSDAKGLAQLAGHGLALWATATAVTVAQGSLWLAPALLAHGVVLIFLFAPLHETIHRTAFRSRWLNDLVAHFCGAVIILPAGYFRAFHFAHHRHTQDPARDPELIRDKAMNLNAYLLTVTGWPYWRERVTTSLRHAAGRVREPFIAAHQKAAIVREARGLWLFYALVAALSLASGSTLALLYWIVPALLGQPFLRCYLLAEHTGCPLVPDMLKNSRTTRSNSLVRALAWNMPYHTAHHAYPAVPFHALPAAHAVIEPQVAVKASGYIAVQREIIGPLCGAQVHRSSR